MQCLGRNPGRTALLQACAAAVGVMSCVTCGMPGARAQAAYPAGPGGAVPLVVPALPVVPGQPGVAPAGTATNPLQVTAAPGKAVYAAGSASAVAVPGTAVTAFPAGSVAAGCRITNPRANTASLWVDAVGTPGTSAGATAEEVLPGGYWQSNGPPAGDVRVNSSAAQPFTAIRW